MRSTRGILREKYGLKVALLALFFCAAFWVADVATESFVFKRGAFLTLFWPSDPEELWMRSVVLIVIVAFAVVLHRSLKQQRRELEQDRLLRTLSRAVEASPATVVVTDQEGRIEYANPKFFSLTGYTPLEVLGQNSSLLKSGAHPPEFYQEMWQALQRGEIWRGQFYNRKKNGECYWESAAISGITDQRGRITHYVAVKEDITERLQMQAQLEMLSTTDPLTGLANRRVFDETLRREWGRAIRSAEPLSLIMADLDHFKTFNDQYGHQEGDAELKRVAQELAASVKRPGDLVARYGGEEFVAVLPSTDSKGALELAHAMLSRVRGVGSAARAGGARALTVSLGVASVIAEETAAPETLVTAADRALYRAKEQGRDRACAAVQSDFEQDLQRTPAGESGQSTPTAADRTG